MLIKRNLRQRCAVRTCAVHNQSKTAELGSVELIFMNRCRIAMRLMG